MQSRVGHMHEHRTRVAQYLATRNHGSMGYRVSVGAEWVSLTDIALLRLKHTFID